jgi:hypothetical protein
MDKKREDVRTEKKKIAESKQRLKANIAKINLYKKDGNAIEKIKALFKAYKQEVLKDDDDLAGKGFFDDDAAFLLRQVRILFPKYGLSIAMIAFYQLQIDLKKLNPQSELALQKKKLADIQHELNSALDLSYKCGIKALDAIKKRDSLSNKSESAVRKADVLIFQSRSQLYMAQAQFYLSLSKMYDCCLNVHKQIDPIIVQCNGYPEVEDSDESFLEMDRRLEESERYITDPDKKVRIAAFELQIAIVIDVVYDCEKNLLEVQIALDNFPPNGDESARLTLLIGIQLKFSKVYLTMFKLDQLRGELRALKPIPLNFGSDESSNDWFGTKKT